MKLKPHRTITVLILALLAASGGDAKVVEGVGGGSRRGDLESRDHGFSGSPTELAARSQKEERCSDKTTYVQVYFLLVKH